MLSDHPYFIIINMNCSAEDCGNERICGDILYPKDNAIPYLYELPFHQTAPEDPHLKPLIEIRSAFIKQLDDLDFTVWSKQINEENTKSISKQFKALNEVISLVTIPKRGWYYPDNTLNIASANLCDSISLLVPNSMQRPSIFSWKKSLISAFIEKSKIISNENLHKFVQNSNSNFKETVAYKIANAIDTWSNIETLKDSYLNKVNLIKESKLHAHMKAILTDSQKETLFKIVLLSRNHPEITLASSNAITILIKANYLFLNKDLSNIRIPGADLSSTSFYNTNFSNSDLKGVNFTESKFCYTNFSNCNMLEINLGYSNLLIGKGARSFAFSPCGQFLISSLGYSDVDLWNIEKKKSIYHFCAP